MRRPARGLAQWPTSRSHLNTGLLTPAGGAEVVSLSFLGLFLFSTFFLVEDPAVADQFLADLGLEGKMAQAVVEQCMSFQVSSRLLSEKFQAELGRINYVTPTSYLELIGTLKALLNVKKTTRLLRSYVSY